MNEVVKMKRDSKRLSTKSERKQDKEFRKMRQTKSKRFMEKSE